jgi:hypothetical protein
MVGIVVLAVLVALVVAARIRRTRRRRADARPVITTWPEIELTEAYGGWNASAYDAGTGRDRTPPAFARRPAGGLLGPTAPRRTR